MNWTDQTSGYFSDSGLDVDQTEHPEVIDRSANEETVIRSPVEESGQTKFSSTIRADRPQSNRAREVNEKSVVFFGHSRILPSEQSDQSNANALQPDNHIEHAVQSHSHLTMASSKCKIDLVLSGEPQNLKRELEIFEILAAGENLSDFPFGSPPKRFSLSLRISINTHSNRTDLIFFCWSSIGAHHKYSAFPFFITTLLMSRLSINSILFSSWVSTNFFMSNLVRQELLFP